MSTKTKTTHFAVCIESYEDGFGNYRFAAGDGVSSPEFDLFGVFADEEDAEEAMRAEAHRQEALRDAAYDDGSSARLHIPHLVVRPYDPEDFCTYQHRCNYTAEELAEFVQERAEEAGEWHVD